MSVSYFIKALDDQNYSEALSLISSEGFFCSLNTQYLTILKSRVLSLQSSQYPTSLKLLILSLVIIYNVKLQPKEQKICVEYLTQTLKSSTYKQICAGLLVRLPNFQNKHTVLTHLHPSAIPLNLMVDIAAEIKKNKPSPLERQLLKHRQKWVLLLNGYQFNFEGLREILNQYKEMNEGSQYKLMKKAESEINFMILRIRNMHSQKIDLNMFCATVEDLIDAQSNEKALRDLSNPIFQLLRSSAYRLVDEIISKLEKKFIRKYQWLLKIISFGLQKIHEYAELTIRILSLIHTVQKVFGNGALEMQKIIFTDKEALIILLKTLLQKSNNNNFFTIQTPILSKKNVYELQVQSDNFCSKFINKINKNHRTELIGIILQIIKEFYSEPHQSTHLAKLSDILTEHQHKLSHQNKQYCHQLKRLMFPKTIVYSPGLEQVYQEIILGGALDEVTKRRKIDGVQKRVEIIQDHTHEMQLIESKHFPRKGNNLNQSQYFSYIQNSAVSTLKNPTRNSKKQNNTIKDSYYSFKNQSEIFHSCVSKSPVQQSLYHSLNSVSKPAQQEDPLEHPLPLEATQQMSKYSFMKNPSNVESQQINRISQKSDKEEGEENNPIKIDDEDSSLIQPVLFE